MRLLNNDSMKKMLPAMGAIALVACTGGAPKGTDPLNDIQKQEIRIKLDRVHEQTVFVQDLLTKADPLFNIYGESTESNEKLIEGVGMLEQDLESIYDDNRFVVADGLTELSGWDAKSSAGKHSTMEDNYIIVQPDLERKSGLRSFGGALLVHEAAHPYYNVNTFEHNHIQEKIESGKWASMDEYVLQTNDVSYLMTSLYRISAYTGSKELSDEKYVSLYKEMVADPEGSYDEEKLEDMYRYVHEYSERSQEEYLEEFMEDWFEGMDRTPYNIWDYYAFMGITKDELQETIADHPDMQEHKRQTANWILDGLENMYPEKVAEIKAEIQSEAVKEKKENREQMIPREGSKRE